MSSGDRHMEDPVVRVWCRDHLHALSQSKDSIASATKYCLRFPQLQHALLEKLTEWLVKVSALAPFCLPPFFSSSPLFCSLHLGAHTRSWIACSPAATNRSLLSLSRRPQTDDVPSSSSLIPSAKMPSPRALRWTLPKSLPLRVSSHLDFASFGFLFFFSCCFVSRFVLSLVRIVVDVALAAIDHLRTVLYTIIYKVFL